MTRKSARCRATSSRPRPFAALPNVSNFQHPSLSPTPPIPPPRPRWPAALRCHMPTPSIMPACARQPCMLLSHHSGILTTACVALHCHHAYQPPTNRHRQDKATGPPAACAQIARRHVYIIIAAPVMQLLVTWQRFERGCSLSPSPISSAPAPCMPPPTCGADCIHQSSGVPVQKA